jgi:hypothetical protein
MQSRPRTGPSTEGRTTPVGDKILLIDSASSLLGLLYRSSYVGLALTGISIVSLYPASEMLASFIVDSGDGALICVRLPPDGGEALVIFSDKKVHAGHELNRRGEARLLNFDTPNRDSDIAGVSCITLRRLQGCTGRVEKCTAVQHCGKCVS